MLAPKQRDWCRSRQALLTHSCSPHCTLFHTSVLCDVLSLLPSMFVYVQMYVCMNVCVLSVSLSTWVGGGGGAWVGACASLSRSCTWLSFCSSELVNIMGNYVNSNINNNAVSGTHTRTHTHIHACTHTQTHCLLYSVSIADGGVQTNSGADPICK